MRREWSGWIRERRWNEFEKLAKTDPDQTLTDTVAELERGFTEKGDRKALRKVLFLLSQAGYRPTPIEEMEPEGTPKALPKEFALLESADSYGESVVTYGVQVGDRVRWLVANLSERSGITRAGEEEMPLETAEGHVQRLTQKEGSPFLAAVVSPEYALGRIANAVAKTKGVVPPVIAYWRSRLPAAAEIPHPAEEIPREEIGDETLKALPYEVEAALPWRLELGAVSPLLREIYEAQAEIEDQEEKAAASKRAIEAARESLFTPDVVHDHANRLLDLAYLVHLHGKEGAGRIVYAADDLRQKGHLSEYGAGLLDKTLFVLIESFRKESQRAQA